MAEAARLCSRSGSRRPVAAVAAKPAVDLEAVLLDVVAEKTGYPAEMLELDMDIEADLGIDSIKRVEILAASAGARCRRRRSSPVPSSWASCAPCATSSTSWLRPRSLPPPAAPPPAQTAAAAAAPAGRGRRRRRPRSLRSSAEKTGYPADMLELDMDIEADLGIDSIKRVEIMGVMQERFGELVAAGPEQLGELRTLRHIVDFMAGGTDAQSPPRPPRPRPPTRPPPSPPPTTPAPASAAAQAALVTLATPDLLVGAYPQGSGALVVDDGCGPRAGRREPPHRVGPPCARTAAAGRGPARQRRQGPLPVRLGQ